MYIKSNILQELNITQETELDGFFDYSVYPAFVATILQNIILNANTKAFHPTDLHGRKS